MKKVWTVYFGSVYNTRGRKTGTPKEIKSILERWREFGAFVFEIEQNVWVIEI